VSSSIAMSGARRAVADAESLRLEQIYHGGNHDAQLRTGGKAKVILLPDLILIAKVEAPFVRHLVRSSRRLLAGRSARSQHPFHENEKYKFFYSLAIYRRRAPPCWMVTMRQDPNGLHSNQYQ
jgi:hypothetical protein